MLSKVGCSSQFSFVIRVITYLGFALPILRSCRLLTELVSNFAFCSIVRLTKPISELASTIPLEFHLIV
ncbi:hypothetical protein RJT34_24441 [Clitoria ternatea]|uniref:Uncharacterized protein n=1 Tax=Clitoria ternatea TaxID=43366 RepID=A0AAN9FU50_CLITE